MRILAVDDEKDTLKLVHDLLVQAGHSVVCAASAVKALAHLKMEKFDLILLDIMMPGMDGLQLAQTISGQWDTFEIPIVFITCRKDEESKSWAKITGCFRYIEKPFGPEELLETIEDIERGKEEESRLVP